jgi:16S rRNA (adenine1518-N6/adenine1519-N6)-dimethyltransferase
MLETLIEQRIKPKRSLSQNFLINTNAARRIVESLNLKKNETVLEIGSGKGALTRYLIERSRRVIGVEIDKALCDYLKKRFTPNENLEIIHHDFLKIDFEKVISPDKKVRVIGNLPYQITSPALALLLENRKRIKSAVLMVQKEVAQRICARPGTKNWSPLSIGIQLYSDPQILFKLKPSSFKPSPRVESAVIRLNLLKKPKVKIEDENFFFKLVKAAFAQRRKMVLNSVSSSLSLGKDLVLKALEQARIDPKRRAEALSLEELTFFSNVLNKL